MWFCFCKPDFFIFLVDILKLHCKISKIKSKIRPLIYIWSCFLSDNCNTFQITQDHEQKASKSKPCISVKERICYTPLIYMQLNTSDEDLLLWDLQGRQPTEYLKLRQEIRLSSYAWKKKLAWVKYISHTGDALWLFRCRHWQSNEDPELLDNKCDNNGKHLQFSRFCVV